jgi:alkylation response protein AidB-like acyl-CoA dehydrogenase
VLAPDDNTAFAILPTDREGVELVDDWDGFGQRLTGTGTTLFTNVWVEADEVILDTAPDKDYLPLQHCPATDPDSNQRGNYSQCSTGCDKSCQKAF